MKSLTQLSTASSHRNTVQSAKSDTVAQIKPRVLPLLLACAKDWPLALIVNASRKHIAYQATPLRIATSAGTAAAQCSTQKAVRRSIARAVVAPSTRLRVSHCDHIMWVRTLQRQAKNAPGRRLLGSWANLDATKISGANPAQAYNLGQLL